MEHKPQIIRKLMTKHIASISFFLLFSNTKNLPNYAKIRSLDYKQKIFSSQHSCWQILRNSQCKKSIESNLYRGFNERKLLLQI
ncbi:hypothetical protein IX321_002648 [Bacteroides pyogenes]|nr:hypothetical protein [Bacteroides pyogenes]MBR8718724.1 hypothetical protein [Bacteroides pyogenes]MBR8748191.1 hypothetical protein [Bacteroides pyogenes]MBR8758470.1 hypothetical protein [Bacteroides pyogenes]MBR8781691.1 hypothetical protein [Bacteroides pyogenes]